MSPAAAEQHEVLEISLGPAPADGDGTFVDVVFTDPADRERRVPAFVTGGEWRVRYSSDRVGTHSYRAHLTGSGVLSNPDGTVEIVGARGPGRLAQHGPLRVAADRRHLEHSDGTPFLWLADTWWNGLVDRLSAEEFRELAGMRARQGFSVVQLVAGLYPEMAPFAPEGRSASGWAWQEDFAAPNLAWFDEADPRVRTLVDHDLVPCIFGSWAYYLQFMDVEQTVRHWRELIARWGAYPVVWCLAGEPPLVLPPELLALSPEEAAASTLTAADAARMIQDESAIAEQLALVNEVARAVREAEPFGRPITIHSYPATRPWDYLEDEGVVDFWLLQTGHAGQNSLEPSVAALHEAVEHRPVKPVINGEVCYEGICGSSWHETQRFLFWSHLLSGAAGHTYGAQGLWGFTTAEYPFGLRGRWGELEWPDAAALPGAAHLGTARRILLGLPWQQFEPHPEWIEPHQNPGDRLLPYAAGVPGGARVIYFPVAAFMKQRLGVVCLPGLGQRAWEATYVNPRTGEAASPLLVRPGTDGVGTLRGATPLAHFALPSAEDWLLVLRPCPTAPGAD